MIRRPIPSLVERSHAVLPNSSSSTKLPLNFFSGEITVKKGGWGGREGGKKAGKRGKKKKKNSASPSRSIKLPNSHQETISIPRNCRERDFLGSLNVAPSKSWSINQ